MRAHSGRARFARGFTHSSVVGGGLRGARALGWMVVVWGGLLSAYPAAAITYQTSTPISGDVVPVTVSLSDVPGGGAVNVTVSIPQGDGDLLGFFGTVSDKSLVPQMGVTSTGIVTQWQFAAGSVSKVGGGNTMAPVITAQVCGLR